MLRIFELACACRFAALLSGGALVLLVAPAPAQTPSQDVDRAQFLRNQALIHGDPYSMENGVDEGHAVESPNNPDIGEQEILKRVERYQPFTASSSMPFYYTSNVALAKTGEQSDVLIAPAASVTYAPRITSTFYGAITAQQQYFYYDRFSELNFGSTDFRAGFTYVLPKLHYLNFRAEYDYNRLTFNSSFNDFFSNHSFFVSAELPFRFGRAQQLSIGADANVSIHAEPEAPRRNDFDFYAGYSVNLTRALSLNAVGRLFVRNYYDGDRVDVSEVFALSANFRVNRCFSASAASTLAWSQSNHSVFDYSVANVGGAVSFSFHF